jgi:mono/diheme cytochrome c family protein
MPQAGHAIARPLRAGDRTRDPADVFQLLRGDAAPRDPGTAHIPDFYLDDAEAAAIAMYLATGRGANAGARRAFNDVRRANRHVSAGAGARAFRALNCVACHEHRGVQRLAAGPSLHDAGVRLRPEWLRAFLVRPHAVRPSGARPGSGARMPDFHLSVEQADSIATYLESLMHEGSARPPRDLTATAPGAFARAEGAPRAARSPEDAAPDNIRRMSAFRAAKARSLLENRLSCTGCHSLDGRGGRIAPELTRAGSRLRPDYLRLIVEAPERAAPGTIMPRPLMPPATLDLIVEFLTFASPSDSSAPARRRGYLSLVDPAVGLGAAPLVREGGDGTETLYGDRCAPCHGASGRGDGFNAPYLDRPPAPHADPTRMAARPNDTLYDGIHGGGLVLGGSAQMPPFGQSLSPDEITALVKYIRRLCSCTQPAWAGDGIVR